MPLSLKYLLSSRGPKMVALAPGITSLFQEGKKEGASQAASACFISKEKASLEVFLMSVSPDVSLVRARLHGSS